MTEGKIKANSFEFKIAIKWNLLLEPPLVSDYFSSATSFPKYQKFPSQIPIFQTSCRRPPLVSDRNNFESSKFKIVVF